MRGRRLGLRKWTVWSCVVASALAIALAEAVSAAPAGAFAYSRSMLPDAVDRTAADAAGAVARDTGERPLAPGQLRPLGYLTDSTDPAAAEMAVDASGMVV